ncbi:phospholipid methyltransferase-domain-containing protein [Fimicolochytrium jonesii]|uniref:phospholipid methyltransferase-domain-containing protein n=1 Tax=Fimicolochytrium jonesii TaxID=1396493 RepID=UPI0022FDB15C|nr:phospholipid methyltransferase-domain-containing protein [Fimicolochytrium jonesii]KAI8826844.1 phospholipid methyltransferase-domain-containing protein [Fimicolochytrium jonesii]
MTATATNPLENALDAFAQINWAHPSLWIAAGSIVFNPTMWNIVARNEYRNQSLTRLLGSPIRGCYLLAFAIFTLGLLRDYLFTVAMDHQPVTELLDHSFIKMYAVASMAVGNVLVLSSMFKLGITGTYLGDYFGILMEKRVTGFPFNLIENPMYFGSTLCFLGGALWRGSPAGLVLTAVVYLVYAIAVESFEGPFTAQIYARRDKLRSGKKE